MAAMKRAALVLVTSLLLVATCSGQDFKPGACPVVVTQDEETCAGIANMCTTDHDCSGEDICCGDGCKFVCTEPIDNIPTTTEIRYAVLACEGAYVDLTCNEGYTIEVTAAFWGRGDAETCADPPAAAENVTQAAGGTLCSLREAGRFLRELCQGEKVCRVPASIGYFGDPCPPNVGKYLRAEYICKQKTHSTLQCEDSGKLPLACPENTLIQTEYAFFGRRDLNTTCPHRTANVTDNCTSGTATEVFKQICDGKNRCEIGARSEFFGDPCPGSYKYLELTYSCSECTNEYGSDADCEYWAGLGDCVSNKDWMIPNCRKTCWQCDDSPHVCSNDWANETACDEWALGGDCDTNPAWMWAYCYKSCGRCDYRTGCTRNHYDDVYGIANVNESACLDWYYKGECELTSDFMLRECRRECFECYNGKGTVRCSDLGERCEFFATLNSCELNPGYMFPNCYQTCTGCTEDPKCENVYGDDFQCEAWKADGQCRSNPVYMYKECWKTCVGCEEPVCENAHGNDKECEFWAMGGQCDDNPGYMMDMCYKSCTRCGRREAGLNDCINVYTNETACEDWAARGDCASNPTWMWPNCRLSCSLCDKDTLDLRMVGNDAVPGVYNNFTRSTTFILPGSFPQYARLTHFSAYFATDYSVYMQVWGPLSGNEWEARFAQRVVPVAAGYAQTILVDRCVYVQPGDRIGFSVIGNASPIGQNFDLTNVYDITYYRNSLTRRPFTALAYPYRFSFSAGWDTETC